MAVSQVEVASERRFALREDRGNSEVFPWENEMRSFGQRWNLVKVKRSSMYSRW